MHITLDDIKAASRIVYADMPPTPQYRWPMLGERLGAELWVKHENHSPIGAFKIRGGLVQRFHRNFALPVDLHGFQHIRGQYTVDQESRTAFHG